MSIRCMRKRVDEPIDTQRMSSQRRVIDDLVGLLCGFDRVCDVHRGMILALLSISHS